MEEEDYEILSTSAKEKEDGYYYWFVNCNSSTKPTFNDNIVFSIPIHNEVVAAEVLTTIMAVLSIFGCALIIFSYIAYKDIRTKARVMLFHLSIADLIITISSLFGLYMNFIRITDEITQPPHTKGLRKASFIVNSTTDPRCYTQAAITTYGTIASLLWSNVIGIVMVVLVLKRDKSQQINHVIYVVACFVCWLLPLIIVIIDGAFRLFGFVIITSTGCYIFSTPKNHLFKYQLAEFFSYDLWLCLTLILLPILYSILFYYTHCKFKHKALLSWKGSPDIKLLLVPIIFILMRIWSAIFRVLIYYTDYRGNHVRSCHTATEIMLVVDGVGANAQGAVNAVLFCLLTRTVRIRMWRTCRRLYRRICRCGKRGEMDDVHSPTDKDSLFNYNFNWPTSSYETLNH